MAAQVSDQYVLDFLPGRTPSDEPAITVICKRGYRIDEVEAIAIPHDDQDQPPLYGEAQFYSDVKDGQGSIRVDSDYYPFKHKVDVNIVGRALAPHGKPVEEFEVSARIGSIERTLRIVGPRYARWSKQKKGTKKKPADFVPPKVSDPEPIGEVPIRYEYAFGGSPPFIPQNEEAFQQAIEAVEKQQEEEREAKEQAAAAVRAEEERKALDEAKESFFSEQSVDDYFTQSAPSGAHESEEALSRIGGDGTKVLTRKEMEEAAALVHEEETLRERAKGELAGEVVVSESALDVHDAVETEEVLETTAPPSGGTQVFDLRSEGDIRLSDDNWAERAAGEAGREKRTEVEAEDPFAEYPKIAYPQNPVGMGLIVCRDERLVEGLALPLIEHPEFPIDASDLYREMPDLLSQGPLPGGFGVVAGGWQPRSEFSGVPKEHLEKVEDELDKRILELDPENEKDRAELEALLAVNPPLFQGEWYNSAVPQWQLDRLHGNEEVVLRNMTESGTLYFKMPGDRPMVSVDRGRGSESVSMQLDTCSILVDELSVELVWRGHLVYGGPEELAEYPKLELSVQPGHWRDEVVEKSSRRREGGTQVLDLADLDLLEEEEPMMQELEPSGSGFMLDDARDEEGTLREDRMGDVKHSDDAWIQETLDRMDTDKTSQEMMAERTDREERKQQVESVRERLAELAEENKKKKKRKKRD